MTSTQLKAMLPEFQHKKFRGVGDEKLLSYVRIYAALYHLTATNALDDEYGDRQVYLKKLHTLFALIARRYTHMHAIVPRTNALSALFYIVQGTSCVIDREKEELCCKWADKLLSDYFSDTRNSRPDVEELHGVIRLIYVYLYGIAGEEAQNPWLGFARGQIRAWAGEADACGKWENILPEEALRRIISMSMNSYMTSDHRYDKAIQTGYRYYCRSAQLQIRQAGKLSPELIRFYALMYDAAEQGIIHDNGTRSLLNDLAELMNRQLAAFSTSSDETLLCQNIVIDNLCRHIAADAQQKLWYAGK